MTPIRRFFTVDTMPSALKNICIKFMTHSVRPRDFLGTDTEDGIEAILTERTGHSLHEYIDGDDPLRPFIDFDLPIETLDKIELKITGKETRNLLCRAFKEVCVEIY